MTIKIFLLITKVSYAWLLKLPANFKPILIHAPAIMCRNASVFVSLSIRLFESFEFEVSELRSFSLSLAVFFYFTLA